MSRYFNESMVEDIYLDESSPDELAHFGVLGQKWGIRRYQNKDGTLTSAGKRRYKISSDGKMVKRSREEVKSYDKKVKTLKKASEEKKKKQKSRAKALEKNDINEMANNPNYFTTEEINQAVSRNQALTKLKNEQRTNAAEAQKWITTATSYLTAVQAAYKAISSDEVQGLISQVNDKYGTSYPLFASSYDNYLKISGKGGKDNSDNKDKK